MFHSCFSFLQLTDLNTVQQSANVLVATPTGFLACKYKQRFGDDITTDTLHGQFKIPLNSNDHFEINWNISIFDVIILDEVSMISLKNFRHIWRTINEASITPLLLMCGDTGQMKPIETVDAKVRQTESMLTSDVVRQFSTFFLNVQYRCEEPYMNEFLNGIRTCTPTKSALKMINNACLISAKYNEAAIFRHLVEVPDCVILTVTRSAANALNMKLAEWIFENEIPLNTVQLDMSTGLTPIYTNLKVVITQNRDKENSVVNGQSASVVRFENQTIFVKLSTGKVVPIYKVHSADGNAVYPLMLRYALTIAKVQGQTLSNVLIYLDTATLDKTTSYVALSRVKQLSNMKFVTKLTKKHFYTS